MKVTPISIHFDGMAWPRLNETFATLTYNLRYQQHLLTKNDLLLAATILSAFDSLIHKPQKDRNYICAKIKRGSK